MVKIGLCKVVGQCTCAINGETCMYCGDYHICLTGHDVGDSILRHSQRRTITVWCQKWNIDIWQPTYYYMSVTRAGTKHKGIESEGENGESTMGSSTIEGLDLLALLEELSMYS